MWRIDRENTQSYVKWSENYFIKHYSCCSIVYLRVWLGKFLTHSLFQLNSQFFLLNNFLLCLGRSAESRAPNLYFILVFIGSLLLKSFSLDWSIFRLYLPINICFVKGRTMDFYWAMDVVCYALYFEISTTRANFVAT